MKKDLYYYLRRAYKRFLREMRSSCANGNYLFVPCKRITRPDVDRHAYRTKLKDNRKKHQRHEQHK